MYRTADNRFLVLKLKDGIRYEEATGDRNMEERQRFTRFRFNETEQKFDLSFRKMVRTNVDLFSTAQMMDLKQLKLMSNSTRRHADSGLLTNYAVISPYIKYFNIPKKSVTGVKYRPFSSDNILDSLNPGQKLSAFVNATNEVRSVRDMVKIQADSYKDAQKNIRKYAVEYQKKFVLPAVCIALFLIGAPLGAIIRKGGMGMPVVVSVIFFVIYYIISTIGETSVKEGSLSPFIGMWIAVLILTPVGLFLSYKAANDSALFDIEAYKRFFTKLLRREWIGAWPARKGNNFP